MAAALLARAAQAMLSQVSSGAEPVRIVAVLHARHACWEGLVKLLSDGMFLGGAASPGGCWEWDASAQTLLLRWLYWRPDHLGLCEWGLEGPNLRLEFTPDTRMADWRRAMAEPVLRPPATPRVIVRYQGRLGNQLFQFACGWVLARRFRVPLSAGSIDGFPATGQFRYRRPPLHALETAVHDDMRVDFEACGRHLLGGGELVVNGYHQRYEILRPMKGELKAVLSVRDFPSPRQLPGADDLVVHVRLTDYFHPHAAWLFAYPLDEILKVIGRQRFDRLLVVTDEPGHPFIQRLQADFGAVIGQPDPLADFAVMLAARRLLISPSTFSWWAAWLSHAEQIWFPRDRGAWHIHKGVDLWVDDEPRYISW